MYGAILGDIIGSPFEFDRGDKTKNFDLFSKGCGFTDDSVMTIAVGEALLAVRPKAAVKEIEDAVASNMQDWGKRYPHAGYGGSFRHWLKENNPKPYGSYGNGSAMRVSAAGWLYDSMERTREVARATANVTHNHPEGIKGAEATASAIYMARNGSSKEEIKEYIESEFHYDLSRTLDNIRPYYHHVESCQETVPEAIIAFLESKDFEDAVRNAVSLGGDTDFFIEMSDAPDKTAELCRVIQPHILMMEITGQALWSLKERLAICREVRRYAPNCKFIFTVDEKANAETAKKVVECKKTGLIDCFIYNTISSSYMTAVLDSL